MPVALLSLSDTLQVSDWFLTSVILTLLIMLLIMGPHRYAYLESVSSMFRFKNPDGDVSYPLLSTLGYLLVFVLSCMSIGIAFSVYSATGADGDPTMMHPFLWYSLFALACLSVRLLLITSINKVLYNRQVITLKPGRWNCFFVMTVSVFSLFILMVSMLVLFLDLPVIILPVFASLIRILAVTGRFFKIKTTLFKNKSSNSGFILYLCAFEIAPIYLEYVLSDILFGQI